MSSKTRQSNATLPFSLILPIILGLAAFVVLYTLINHQVIDNEIVSRYLAGHTVSKVTTALFLIAFSSLLLIGRDVMRQFRWLNRISLKSSSPKPANADPTDDREAEQMATTEQLCSRLQKYEPSLQRTYLWRRLMKALNFVKRNGSADGLDDEIKYAAELDADDKQDRYSFARIMIWAIPMLGFLGTVLGISEALGGIDVGEDNDFQAMMGGLRSSLYVAFDTTAIALTFAIILMFVLFGVERFESTLLLHVDQRARDELTEHWTITNQAKDSYVQTVEAIGTRVLESTENLVERQIKLWRTNIEAAELAWVDAVSAAQESVQSNLRSALDGSTSELGQKLDASIRRCDEAMARRWEQWQVTLSENARRLSAHQEHLVEHSKNITGAVEQIGSLTETRAMLSDCLQALPDASAFVAATEQLSTAIRLLEFRLCELQHETPESTSLPIVGPTEKAA